MTSCYKQESEVKRKHDLRFWGVVVGDYSEEYALQCRAELRSQLMAMLYNRSGSSRTG